MQERKNFAWQGWVLILAVPALQACSAFPQLIRHGDALTPEEHVRLGVSYETQGLKDEAGDQYEAALRAQKKYIPALIARGNLAFGSGDLPKAETYYRRVLRLDRGHAGANNNMAMIFLARGTNLGQAERFVRTALERETSLRPYILETLVAIHIEGGRYSEARKALDEADRAAPPDDAPLREHLAETRKKIQP